jgi:hypothetical protein
VILSGDFQRVQVLLSGNENNQCLLTCIGCTYESGKVCLEILLNKNNYSIIRLLLVLEIKFVFMNQHPLPNDHYIMFVLFLFFLFLIIIYLFLASQLSMVINTYINMFK